MSHSGERLSPFARHAFMERRAFIQWSVAASVAAAAGCGTPERSNAAPPSTTGIGTGPAAAGVADYDPDVPYWQQGGFSSVTKESTFEHLEVVGALPPSLSGLYVRNGSNPEHNDASHWFFGSGMLHGLRLDAGKASWYRNRYVRTPLLGTTGGIGAKGAPTGPNSMSNVSLIHHDRLLSLGEVGFPFEISKQDLSTVGPYDFDGKLTTSMTAHPKIDPATGTMHFFGYSFLTTPYLTYHVADASGALVSSQDIELPDPVMIHDFAITEHHALFWIGPVVFDLSVAMDGGMPFVWRPEAGSRLGIMPLGGPAGEIRWIEMDNCFVFHGVNAAESNGLIDLDVCRLDSTFEPGMPDAAPTVHRWSVDTKARDWKVRDTLISDEAMDLPNIDRRYVGREQRHGWFAQTSTDGDYGFEFAGITRHDYRDDTDDRWVPSANYRAGEGFFVPDAETAAEGEGWILTFAYDRTRDASDLCVLDALDMAAGPVARVPLPVRVPYGFHAVWVPEAELN